MIDVEGWSGHDVDGVSPWDTMTPNSHIAKRNYVVKYPNQTVS